MNGGFIQFPIIAIILVVLGFGAGITSTLTNKNASSQERAPEKEIAALTSQDETTSSPTAAKKDNSPVVAEKPQENIPNAKPEQTPNNEATLSADAELASASAEEAPIEAEKIVQVTEQIIAKTGEENVESCYTDVKPQFTADITDFSKIWKITAPGTASIEGPKGHSFVWTRGFRVPVYAPTDIILDSGSYSKNTEDSPAQYLLFFRVKSNCNYTIKFDHIDEPTDFIAKQLPATPAVADSRTSEIKNKIEFKAGDLIGFTRGTIQAGNWDFGLYNLAEEGILKTQYNSYGIHGYAVCWTDFYTNEAKKRHYRLLLEGPQLVCFF